MKLLQVPTANLEERIKEVGTSAAPVKVKRGEGKVRLTFKAPGYAPQDVEVSAAANGVATVTLKKAGPSAKRGELEF